MPGSRNGQIDGQMDSWVEIMRDRGSRGQMDRWTDKNQ